MIIDRVMFRHDIGALRSSFQLIFTFRLSAPTVRNAKLVDCRAGAGEFGRNFGNNILDSSGGGTSL